MIIERVETWHWAYNGGGGIKKGVSIQLLASSSQATQFIYYSFIRYMY